MFSKGLRQAGYDGFVTIGTLRETGFAGVPHQPGVYLALYPSDEAPRFLPVSPAATLGREDATIPVGELEDDWVDGALVLYAGMAGGKGKRVIAGATVPDELLRLYLRTDADELQRFWQSTVQAHLQAASLGYNGHLANGLTALFIATGQDVANVANSAVGITSLEKTPAGDLHLSVTLPSLSVATVGGGTHQGTARECLELLDCLGAGKARKLAEITAASLLAGELSMAAAIASGEFVNAHETYGRNRP